MLVASDARLVARVRVGDRDAAEALARRYLASSRALALALLGNVADADDVCQDAFLIAMREIHQCRQPSRFGAWLSQIVRNRARDMLRLRSTRVIVAMEDVVMPFDARQLDEVERSEQREVLLEALEQLEPAHREAILLHDMEGWKHREIAAFLG